ncbi:restriction endonuclease subunit S [Vreelandella subglaciescola]|uniref:Type I restriction enzyme, S subunit n=1 Tax=Vreelandella subglaciescola TaxID=29571 RepID=A0A1M7FXI8_9GAMM|nr:restriction endonuclease subunit S [Halomonas subglaciescola]SHM08771.1 type I restriction enzyme, S subunit [Halomonas subglaciescola]
MSFTGYPEYKDSGVEWLGAVPVHWQVQPLKRQCNVMPSNVDKKSVEGERTVLLCNYTDVYYHSEIVQGMCFMKATASEGQIEKFSLQKGDVIFTKDSESSDDIAIAAHVPETLPGVVCGYHLSIVRPHFSIFGQFLKHYFDSASAKFYFNISANGLTRVGLGQYASDNLPIPLPPLEEQGRIAAFLDHETARIDALIAEQQRLIKLLKEKRQAVISHAVTKGLDPDAPMKDSGVEWLGDVPAHWEVKPLKRAINSVESGTSVNAADVPAAQGELGVLKTSCVYKGWFDWRENKTVNREDLGRVSCPVRENTLIVSRMNTPDLVGSAGLVLDAPAGIYLPDRLWQVSLEEMYSSKYYYFFTRTPAYPALFTGLRQKRRWRAVSLVESICS